jgi:hypothetical protein
LTDINVPSRNWVESDNAIRAASATLLVYFRRWAMISRIILELESPGDSWTMFRIVIDDLLFGENLTAVQAHIIVGEALDRITDPPAPKPERGGKQQIAERPLDEVEWELVRADIAHLTAEQEKSGDRQKWETDQRVLWRDGFASLVVAPLDHRFTIVCTPDGRRGRYRFLLRRFR